MHGRKKVTVSDAEKALLREKANTYSALLNVITQKRKASDFSLESLKLTEKVLKVNPDFYSLWNYRRKILIHLNEFIRNWDGNNKIPVAEGHSVVESELKISEEGIKRNPKSC